MRRLRIYFFEYNFWTFLQIEIVPSSSPFSISEMVLISDAFHSTKGHDTCPTSFKRKYWQQLWEISRDDANERFNTSAAEQLNSFLRNSQKMVRCSSLSNAKLYIDMQVLMSNLLMLGIFNQQRDRDDENM